MADGTIGGIKKQYVYIGGGLVIVVAGVVWFRSKSQSNANAGSVTDPAGNVCSALDPNSGYCPGTPQDMAYQQSAGYTLAGSNPASYVGGQVIGYDQYGNPIYSSGPSSPGPGSYTSNAEWAQAALTYLTQNEPNADPATIAAALGQYINGKPATEAQISIINQAITFEGIPPVGGPNGDPPGIITAGNPPGGGGGSNKVTVPNVIGKTVGAAHNEMVKAGLVPSGEHFNTSLKVIGQTPKAGSSVNAGTVFTLTPEKKTTKKG